MTAPIRHSIKLNTVRKLHLFVAADALEFPLPLLIPPLLASAVLISAALVGFSSKVLEFYHILGANPGACVQVAQVGRPSGAYLRGVRHGGVFTGGIFRDRRQGFLRSL